MTYEELLQLNDEVLEKKNVTMGARGKILKYIGHIKDRPNTIKECARELTVSQIFFSLKKNQYFFFNFWSFLTRFDSFHFLIF